MIPLHLACHDEDMQENGGKGVLQTEHILKGQATSVNTPSSLCLAFLKIL